MHSNNVLYMEIIYTLLLLSISYNVDNNYILMLLYCNIAYVPIYKGCLCWRCTCSYIGVYSKCILVNTL